MAHEMCGKAANEDTQMGLKKGSRLQESVSWGVPKSHPSITCAQGMQARRCNPPARGDSGGCTDKASALARGSRSAEHLDAAPGDVQLSP